MTKFRIQNIQFSMRNKKRFELTQTPEMPFFSKEHLDKSVMRRQESLLNNQGKDTLHTKKLLRFLCIMFCGS